MTPEYINANFRDKANVCLLQRKTIDSNYISKNNKITRSNYRNPNLGYDTYINDANKFVMDVFQVATSLGITQTQFITYNHTYRYHFHKNIKSNISVLV